MGYSTWGRRVGYNLVTKQQRSVFHILIPFILSATVVAQLVKNPPAIAGDLGLIPRLGRSPAEGNGYPLQYSGLENSKDCIVHLQRVRLN